MALLREKNMSIRRLRKLIFGPSSERSSDIMPSEDEESAAAEGEEGKGEAGEEEQPADAAGDQSLAEQASDESDESDESDDAEPPSSDSNEDKGKGKKRRKGHGRNPAKAYTGCNQVVIMHESLHPGDPCPQCSQGTVYRWSNWSPVVRLKGQVPVTGSVYQLEQLRCHLCGDLYTAQLPPEAGPSKYDPTVPSVIATLRYGEGFPWNRLQRMQQFAGIPLPASTQWELVRDAIPGGIEAAYKQLLGIAAQGELFHNDDTSMTVLSLKDLIKKQQPLLEKDPERRGVYTSAILSRAEGRPSIALFFTGPHHAGENLGDVLAKREQELPPPIQMCDALSRNMPRDLRAIIANCLAHGRRKFVEILDAFESEVKYVIKCLKKVYRTDAEAREQQLSPVERLKLHQQQSQPVMEELHRWLKQQLDERMVEPNSSLGGAISYMLNHWEKLTLFLRVPGAPLDNNLCEQALKMAIRHRKNSLFYKTMRGALVGDLYMSLIHTCYYCGADPFDYLTQLQRNSDHVTAAPGDWMPWNYREQLAPDEMSADSHRGPPAGPHRFTAQNPSG